VADPVRYRSADEDSARWRTFEHRPGDIVISTRSKHGTTWMQMICALLVLQRADLPAPLARLSPWLDWRVEPRAAVFDRLQAQRHRRFIKTHTPLDGLPLHPRVTYIVVARHPLDAALSLYHQSANIDRRRLAELTGGSTPSPGHEQPSPAEWLRAWIAADPAPADALDSLPGVLHHLSDAWARRHDLDVVFVHYDSLLGNLGAEMQQLAAHLSIPIEPARLAGLVAAATFESMRSRADLLAPDPMGVLIDRDRFFRAGVSGQARVQLTGADLARYGERTAAHAPTDLVEWLHG